MATREYAPSAHMFYSLRWHEQKQTFDFKPGYHTQISKKSLKLLGYFESLLSLIYIFKNKRKAQPLLPLTGVSPAALKLLSFAHTHKHVARRKSFKGNKHRGKANTEPLLHAGAKKGLKSRQPLRMFLLRLNWTMPLHIKLQKKRTVEGGRLGVEIDTNHQDHHHPNPPGLLQPIQGWNLWVVYWAE